jgi:hypothetical protein
MTGYQPILDPNQADRRSTSEASIIAELTLAVSKSARIDVGALLRRQPFAGGRIRWCLAVRQLRRNRTVRNALRTWLFGYYL